MNEFIKTFIIVFLILGLLILLLYLLPITMTTIILLSYGFIAFLLLIGKIIDMFM